MGWQLVVHDDAELTGLVTQALRDALAALKVTVVPVEARNIERARLYLKDMGTVQCSVVVIGSTTPLDARAPVGLSGRDPTRQFIRDIKRERPDLPVIVLANTPDSSLDGFLEAFDHTAIVAVDVKLVSSLTERLADFHGAIDAREEARVELHLHLGDGQQGSWQIKRRGNDPIDIDGSLFIDGDLLERVLFESSQIEDSMLRLPRRGRGRNGDDRWIRALKFLSKDLRSLLFDGCLPNVSCWQTFLKHRERVGGIENTRIRVTVNSSTHPMLVEALRDLDANDSEYWALRAPLFRRYDRPAARRPLFKDPARRQSPINCLLIEADGRDGNLPEYPDLTLDALSHCKEELHGIVRLLREAGLRAVGEAPADDPNARVRGCYEHLRLEEAAGDLRQVVADKLKERPWHVVHFCGHVVGSDTSDAAVVLVAEPGGAMSVAALAAQLEHAELMFLSSCRSTSTRIVLQAVEQFIPAVLGFQWVVDDAAAAEFSQAFYRALFDARGPGYKYLEYAFLQARRTVYQGDPRAPTWVAPVLVMQMDWQIV